jgi:hypothetical protein
MEKEKPKQKKYYTVELECIIPATIKCRVLVEDGAYELALTEALKNLQKPILQMGRMKKISAKISDSGTNMVRYTRKF